MTFLIGSIRPADVLVTADGRCQKLACGKVTAVEDDYRKIHPIPDHPLAIVHHGENLIAGRPVAELVAAFARNLNAGNLTVPQVADQLRDHAHAAAFATARSRHGSIRR